LGERAAHLTVENSFSAESEELAFCSERLLRIERGGELREGQYSTKTMAKSMPG
jgi:hypothetical protein